MLAGSVSLFAALGISVALMAPLMVGVALLAILLAGRLGLVFVLALGVGLVGAEDCPGQDRPGPSQHSAQCVQACHPRHCESLDQCVEPFTVHYVRSFSS